MASSGPGAVSQSVRNVSSNAGNALASRSIATPEGDVPILPVSLMIIGLYLAWFGIHYWASDVKWPSDPIKALLTGKPLPVADQGAAAAQIANVPAVLAAGGSAAAAGGAAVAQVITGAGQDIATAALKYKDAGYVFGGKADRVGNWDCSSYTSYVLGHDLGKTLPGGGRYGDPAYPPHTHGPTTLNYMLFGQAVARSDIKPGDLVVSTEHMGIVINATQYISARTPAKGVGIDNLSDPFPGGAPVFRRVAP